MDVDGGWPGPPTCGMRPLESEEWSTLQNRKRRSLKKVLRMRPRTPSLKFWLDECGCFFLRQLLFDCVALEPLNVIGDRGVFSQLVYLERVFEERQRTRY